MSGIIEYIKNYRYTFSQKHMNDVDALALSQFSYLKLKTVLPGLEDKAEFMRLTELMEKIDDKVLFADSRYEENNRALVEAMLESPRFRTITMNYHIDKLDQELELQFSATTFQLSDGSYYVAFRGTDENLVGWKEDFSLAFCEPCMGQLCGVKYLEKAARLIPGEFSLGGHSKGGNLAVFAAMRMPASVQERITKTYSFDGPSFRPEVLKRFHYEKIEPKIHKFIPKSSLVGMLLEQGEHYRVVESTSFGLTQHDPYTWEVDGTRFVEAEELDKSVKWVDETVNDWILSLDDEHIGNFAEILFQVLGASEATNLIDMAADWKKSVMLILKEMKEIDPESSQYAQKVLKGLFKIAQKRLQKKF